MIGKKFHRLLVVADAQKRGDGKKWFVCKCDCGNTKEVAGTCLRTGNTKSCGCYNNELRSKNGRQNATHGETRGEKRSTEYKLWHTMIQRCEYPKHRSYKNYGAKGISVCERWRSSFENFLQDIGRKPSPKYTIERKDSAGNYGPGNCRWATYSEQARNRSTNKVIKIDGASKCISEWLEISKSGVSKELCHWRMKNGWGAKKAIFTPPGKYVWSN